MKLHLNKDDDINLVRTYAADQVTVGNSVYRSSLILTPDRVIADWKATSAVTLTEDDFRLMAGLSPQVLLLGTGGRIHFPPTSITRPLIDKSVGLEVMTTAAACRTYNILAGEGRGVVAALIVERVEEDDPDG